MKKHIWTACFLLFGFFIHPTSATEIRVFAAASLSDVLTRLAPDFQKQTGHTLVFNFGASNILARQIESGAPADLFISADEAKMDELEQKDLLLKGSRRSVLSNQLVIITSADANFIHAPADLASPQVKHLALAEPKAVPAGIYAKAYLTRLALWSALENKIIPTENVRGALAAVKSGNAEAAMVYKTDAMTTSQVKIAYAVPVAEGPKISYPFAILKSTTSPESSQQALTYLTSANAQQAYRDSGFIALP